MNKHMISLVIASFAVSACVTINIYFPAAATEKAADKIIDEVWQLKKPEQSNGKETIPAENNSKREAK